MDAESKCPVMHGAITKNMGEGTSNREWWPNQLQFNFKIFGIPSSGSKFKIFKIKCWCDSTTN